MKQHTVRTSLPTELIREFESFYENTQDCYMGRRIRDMLLQYFKSVSAKEDIWVNHLMFDFDSIFTLIDACEDVNAGIPIDRRRRFEEREAEFGGT